MTHRVAVAGATGYTGRRIIEHLATNDRWDSRALVRPESANRTGFAADQDVAICEMHDVAALAVALRDCDAVIQTIGTTRSQFDDETSYETVDYGTTVALLEATQAVGVPRFLLLSSVGAGTKAGAYLKWKARTEQIVRESGLDWTILRPSAIVGPGRRPLQVVLAPLTPLSRVPIASGLASWLRSITADDLARCFIACLDKPETINQTLEGPALWAICDTLDRPSTVFDRVKKM